LPFQETTGNLVHTNQEKSHLFPPIPCNKKKELVDLHKNKGKQEREINKLPKFDVEQTIDLRQLLAHVDIVTARHHMYISLPLGTTCRYRYR
jgi:hypothetical protein